MSLQADNFEILRDTRALYLKHLGALLQDSGLISAPAIRAIQDGAGAWFDEVVSTRRRGSFAEEADGLTSSRITLVGEDDLELGIRLDNLSAKLFETTGGGLWKLHLRFVTLLRRADLAKTDNPVGPKGIAQGLDTMFAAAGAGSLEQKLALLDRIEDCLQRGLPALYAEINDFLDRGGIETAQPNIVGQESAPRRDAPPAVENPLASLQQALRAQAPAAVAGMAAGGAGGSGAVGSLLSQAMLDQLLARLGDLERQGVFARPAVSGASPSNETLIPELFAGKTGSSRPTIMRSAELGVPQFAREGLAIDTLGMIFEAIFADPELPEVVKTTIASLQIPLLKVAMKDETLFSDTGHPARLMIDHMGLAALGLPVDTPTRHPVCAALVAIATHLRAEQNDPEAFQRGLGRLQNLIAQRNDKLNQYAQALLPLLHQLDRRDKAANQVRHALDALIALDPPGIVRHFLEHTWRHTLLQQWFDQGPESAAWQEHVAVIEQLLWSFKPKTDPEERKTLSRRLPLILKTLKAGMERSGMARGEQDRFLDECFNLQTQALRAAPTTAVTETVAEEILATGLHTGDRTPCVGTLDSADLTLTTLDFADYQPPPARTPPYAVGDWLRFQLDERMLTARICHISPESQRVLLCDADTSVAVAAHPAILMHQIKLGTAQILGRTGLFEMAANRALQGATPA